MAHLASAAGLDSLPGSCLASPSGRLPEGWLRHLRCLLAFRVGRARCAKAYVSNGTCQLAMSTCILYCNLAFYKAGGKKRSKLGPT